jgi:aldehyde:ferredoxin oxidoreductase
MSERTAPWVGRILHVNLSSGTTEEWPTLPHAADYLGGRGLAARLAWDLLPPGVGALDEDNPLMFMPGALVGTPAPSAGRVTVAGASPQAHPHEWFTRSNLGGHWGAELKYAGYDGLVVTGRAPEPVCLYIEDGRAELREAGDL